MGPATTNCSGKVDRATALASCEGLIKKLVRHYGKGNPNLEEDLAQEGRIGLINAADRFDPRRGVKFVTYATELARGEMQHYLRSYGRMIRTPAWVQDLLTKIGRAGVLLERETGHPATAAEVAERIEVPENKVHEALAVLDRGRMDSLDVIIARDSVEDSRPTIKLERLLVKDQEARRIPSEDRLFIEEAIALLPRPQRQVISLYFYRDLTQAEIGRELGRSQNYISYLLRRALSALRARGEACMEEMP